MKRILSVLMLLVMLASLFVLSPAALASEDPPEETEAPKELSKVTTTLDRTPVVLMPVSEPKGAVSSKNASFVSLTWYDKNGNALSADSSFEYMTYRMELRAKADDGYIFSQDLAAYLNNSAAAVTVSADGKYATVTREYEALVYAPRIIKHPWEETVDEGTFVSYVSTAVYATGLTWEFVSPDGQTVFDCKDMTKTFRQSRCENDGIEKIVIYNVPMEMNGWQVRAVFSGAEGTVTRSNPATVKVNIDPNRETPPETPEPTPEPTEEPEETPAPTPEPTPEPTVEPEETPAPAPEETNDPDAEAPASDHEHQFDYLWTADETSHWHECSCGARSDEGTHDMRWKTVSMGDGVAVQEGTCRVCGYRETKQVTVSSTRIINKIPMRFVIGGALGLMALLVVAEAVKRGKRK